MHEFALMTDLVRQIESIAREQNGSAVIAVKLKLGALAHITPHHLEEHFIDSTQGTVAAGARLEIEQLTDIHDPQAQEVVLVSIELAA